MLHCHPVVSVAVAGMEVENKQQVCAFKYDHLISLIQSRDCRLIEAKTRRRFYCSDVGPRSWVLRCFFLKFLRRNNLNKQVNCWCEYRGTLLKNYLNLQKPGLLLLAGLIWWFSRVWGTCLMIKLGKPAPLFLKTIWVSNCIDTYIWQTVNPSIGKGFISFNTEEILFLLSSVQGVCVKWASCYWESCLVGCIMQFHYHMGHASHIPFNMADK